MGTSSSCSSSSSNLPGNQERAAAPIVPTRSTQVKKTLASNFVSAKPWTEEEIDGVLLGAESLPIVGAAGVLVLPSRATASDGRSGRRTCEETLDFDCCDIALASLGSAELSGWGPDCNADDSSFDRLFDRATRERELSEYVAAETKTGVCPRAPSIPVGLAMDQLRALAAEGAPPRPSVGPGLLELARDPRRREECPLCAAEWGRAIEQLGFQPDAAEPLSVPTRRRGGVGKGKMHSLRCTWAWFQQNLSASLCALRFDAQGCPRHRPSSPSTVLPPPIADVWQYWRQKGGRSERDKADRAAAATERLMRGEPTN